MAQEYFLHFRVGLGRPSGQGVRPDFRRNPRRHPGAGPHSRVAAETLCNTGLVVLAGEITTKANVDYIHVARDVLKRIGYDNTDYGIDYKGCAVLVAYDKQSPDIAQGVNGLGRLPQPGRRRPGPDVRLRLRRNAGADAAADLPLAPPGRAPVDAAPRRPPALAAPRRQVAGHRALCRRQAAFAIDTVVLSTQHSPEMSDGPKMKAAAKR
jgi:S-adenosylmethionine synthetase